MVLQALLCGLSRNVIDTCCLRVLIASKTAKSELPAGHNHLPLLWSPHSQKNCSPELRWSSFTAVRPRHIASRGEAHTPPRMGPGMVRGSTEVRVCPLTLTPYLRLPGSRPQHPASSPIPELSPICPACVWKLVRHLSFPLQPRPCHLARGGHKQKTWL